MAKNRLKYTRHAWPLSLILYYDALLFAYLYRQSGVERIVSKTVSFLVYRGCVENRYD
jgi:hypothetical protein